MDVRFGKVTFEASRGHIDIKSQALGQMCLKAPASTSHLVGEEQSGSTDTEK